MAMSCLAVCSFAVIKMANHADTRTTQLYDRRDDAVSLDEYGKVGI
jgi:hypothetical protein